MSSIRQRHALATIVALLSAAVCTSRADAATYRVGPGRTYTNLQAVAGLLNPGDIVEVDGNATYPGDATFRRPGTAANPIVIRGLLVAGKRPVISGGTNTVHFRTDTIGEGADHYVMEGFEITGGTSRCVFHQSDDVTLRDLVVHDCPAHGILGADWGAGSLTVEHSEVYRCGSGDRLHQIYASADQDNYPNSVFRLQYSYIHDANGGNNVKSRAARNEVYYNRIEGAYYHELELIGSECCAENVVREDSDVVGNLFIKKGSNAGFPVTRFGGDGTGQSWGRYRFVNNTVIVSGTGAVFRLFDGLESVEMHNNVFYRSGGPVTITRTVEAVWASGERMAGSNNWISTGSTTVPTQWTGTLSGSSPGFTNAAGGDYSPAASSPLLDAGNEVLSSPLGSPFLDPLFPPTFHPPGTPGAFGTVNPRPVDAQIDIGAYERGSGSAPQLSVSDVSVTEGNAGSANVVFTVTLSPAASTTVTVNYATLNGTATAGSDYSSATGALTFTAGQTSKTVSVAVIGDTVDEPNETFYLTLSGASGATILDGQATGTILDDDVPALTLGINDVSLAEGNSGTTVASFTVTLSAASSSTVTVAFATANGTATAGSDYVAQTGNLTFTAGQTTKTIAVTVNGDTTVEPNETFVVNLSSPSGATLADALGQATITNDDTAPPPTGEPVVWTSAIGVTVNANSLTKTAANGWGNAGAVSTQQLASGDGYVEFTASETTTYRLLGLSNGNTNTAYEDIDFAIDAYAGGQVKVYENGALKGTFGTFGTGDKLRIGVVGGSVRYYKNGTVFYTSTKAPTYPLLVDTALYNTGSTLNAAVVSGFGATTPPPPPPTDDPVVWTSAVGVTVNTNSLTKTAANGWGNAGAVSTQQLASGDGYVEFTASETTTYRLLGLSNGNTNTAYEDIDFAIDAYAGGLVKVYENGALKGTFGTFVAGDKLRIGVVGGSVRYYKNGSVLYTSTGVPTYPLLVDTALYNTGSTLNAAVVSGFGATTPPPPTDDPVVWTSAVGVTVNANSLTKTAANGWGNAGAVSTQQLASGDGYVEFTGSETTTYRLLGLSNGNTNTAYEDIDFAIDAYAGGQVKVYENGALKGTFGTYATGDKLRIGVVGGSVRYYKNGSVLYTSTKVPTYPLLVDTSLYNTGSTLNSAVVSGF